MAKQDLSRHQRGIVNRYYEHRDTIMVQKLGELVSELALAETDKARDRLWKRVETALANTQAKPEQVARVLASRDVAALARLLETLL
jgi:phosphoribosyl-ATP pyrophosphohydrolase